MSLLRAVNRVRPRAATGARPSGPAGSAVADGLELTASPRVDRSARSPAPCRISVTMSVAPGAVAVPRARWRVHVASGTPIAYSVERGSPTGRQAVEETAAVGRGGQDVETHPWGASEPQGCVGCRSLWATTTDEVGPATRRRSRPAKPWGQGVSPRTAAVILRLRCLRTHRPSGCFCIQPGHRGGRQRTTAQRCADSVVVSCAGGGAADVAAGGGAVPRLPTWTAAGPQRASRHAGERHVRHRCLDR